MWKKIIAILTLVMFLAPTVSSIAFAQNDTDVNATDGEDLPDIEEAEADTEDNETVDADEDTPPENEEEPVPVLISAGEEELEDLTEEELDEAGTTPDSFIWGVDKALDKISYLLTFGPEARAKKGLSIAQERLLEIRAMCEAGKIGPCQKAQEAHAEAIEDVSEDLDNLNGDEDALETELEIENEIEEQVQQMTRLKIKIQKKVQLTEEQQTQLNQLVESFEGKASEIKIKLKNKQSETKIKIRERTGLSEEEIEDFVNEIQVKTKKRVRTEVQNEGKESEIKTQEQSGKDDKEDNEDKGNGKGNSKEDKVTGFTVASSKGKKK